MTASEKRTGIETFKEIYDVLLFVNSIKKIYIQEYEEKY